jgi:tetratricopeptide (TPR) repeat protein
VRWFLRGKFHQESGRYPEAIADFRETLRRSENPKKPELGAQCRNFLARLYVTAPAKFRDAREAVVLAERAVEFLPGKWAYQNTLGIAYYRAERYWDATSALQKSLEVGAGQTDAFDLYFLALSEHRLGDPPRARQYFEQAQTWHKSHGSRLSKEEAEELERFRAEAEEVLGPATQ